MYAAPTHAAAYGPSLSSAGTMDVLGAAMLFPAPVRSTARNSASMRLASVRERGSIVDFRWEYANAMAGRLMQTHPLQLIGAALRDVGGPLGHPALIDRYRRVVEHGNPQCFEQVHALGGGQDLVLHRIVRSGDGVLVCLTNLSAQRRQQLLHLAARPQRTAANESRSNLL